MSIPEVGSRNRLLFFIEKSLRKLKGPVAIDESLTVEDITVNNLSTTTYLTSSHMVLDRGTITNELTCSGIANFDNDVQVPGAGSKIYFNGKMPTNNIRIYGGAGGTSSGKLYLSAPDEFRFLSGDVRIYDDLEVVGTLTKGGGSFVIPHPVPEKEKTHTLWHSFVESPTAGDNLYRWQVEVSGGTTTIELPEYYSFLNTDDMVWASPVGHFGAAYGEVSEDQKSLTITANTDGKYNVLLIGTRKDDHAAATWEGVEREGAHLRFTAEDEDDSE